MMMQTPRSILLRLSLLVGLVVGLGNGCAGDGTPEVTAGVDACNVCNMIIDKVNEACGWIHDTRFVPFDSPGCLLRAYQELPQDDRPSPAAIHFADYRDGTFHPASAVTFLLTDHVPTVMDGRVICFGAEKAATGMCSHDDEIVTDWIGYLTRRGEPDQTVEVVVGPTSMQPESVIAAKGDLMVWRVRGEQLAEDLELTIKGYPELAAVTVPASGVEVEFRLLIQRPGAGFPLVAGVNDRPLGMLKVTGAHTLDEEAR